MNFKIKNPIILVSLLIALICFSLSLWQVKRLYWKNNLINNLELAYTSEPINLKTITGDLGNFKFNKVIAKGFFLDEQSMFLGPRVFKDTVGYNLITPFMLDDSRYVLINRGWIKEKKINTNKNKKISIKGIIKEANLKNIFTPKNNKKKNLWYYIDIDQMSEFTGLNLMKGVFLDLISSNELQEHAVPNNSRVKLSNNHLQYAVTWFLLGIVFLIMNYIYLRKKNGN